MSKDTRKDIKRVYDQDIKEKKRTGRGAHSRTGKLGRVGKVTTPADLLTGKDKKAYTQSSPVTTSNIYYDSIMSLEDFKKLSRQKKMLVLDAYRRRYTVREVASAWNLSDNTLYYYFRAYGVAKARKTAAQKNADPNPKPSSQENLSDAGTASKVVHEEIPGSECSFMAVGEFEADSLCRKLQGLSCMLNDDLRYQVEIRVKEIPERAR